MEEPTLILMDCRERDLIVKALTELVETLDTGGYSPAFAA